MIMFSHTFAMQRHAFSVFLLMCCIGLGTAYLVVVGTPEAAVVESNDGVVLLAGMARAGAPLAVEERTASALHSVLFATEYEISPQDITLDIPAVITFRVDDAAATTVYRYRDDIGMWEHVNDVLRRDVDALTVTTRRLGRFRLGYVEDVAAPDFLTVYDTLREGAPEAALGYTIAVGYGRPGEERIRLGNAGEQGGCDGAVLPGKYEARSTDERTAYVLVNDVQTAVEFVFLAQWLVGDGTGCPDGAPFKPGSEYGILPTS